MATHRKPRSGVLQSAPARRGAVGATAAALASVTLLTQSASAEPGGERPGLAETQKKVDELYRQAGAATQQYNAAKEKTDRQRRAADRALDDVADRTAQLNDARRTLGTFAAAQYRNGGMSETATLLLTTDPQSYFQQSHVRARLTEQQNRAVGSFRKKQREATAERTAAARSLADLERSQRKLASEKRTVQGKLKQARTLLAELTAEERARLAAAERKKQEEARRKAAEAERR
ncbi:coiled-coil domain-containing protein, partial [Streptomyces sparsus]